MRSLAAAEAVPNLVATVSRCSPFSPDQFRRRWGGFSDFISQAMNAGGWPDAALGFYRDDNYWWYNWINQTWTWINVQYWYTFAAVRSHRTYILSTPESMLLAVAAACDRPPGPTSDPGAAAAEAFPVTYVEALNADDPERLGAILRKPPGSPEVVVRLEGFGGRALSQPNIRVIPQLPRIYWLLIEATSGDGQSITWAEVIEWNGTGWDLAPLPVPTPTD